MSVTRDQIRVGQVIWSDTYEMPVVITEIWESGGVTWDCGNDQRSEGWDYISILEGEALEKAKQQVIDVRKRDLQHQIDKAQRLIKQLQATWSAIDAPAHDAEGGGQ